MKLKVSSAPRNNGISVARYSDTALRAFERALAALRDTLPPLVHDRLRALLEQERLHEAARIRNVVADSDPEDVADAD